VVRRFHCHVCNRSFSVQTFRVDYRLKRPGLTAPIFDDFVSKVTQRQSARTLGTTRHTVRRRLLLLARHALDFQNAVLKRAGARRSLRGHFQLDELETFELDRRLRPVTMPVLIHERSRFVVYVAAAALAARGNLRPGDLERKRRIEAVEGVRRSGSRRVVKRCFRVLARSHGADGTTVVVTDQKSSYATALAEAMTGPYAHATHSGKAAKSVENPLWPINHTLAMVRDGLSRLVQRTWGVTKERWWLARHAWIWIAYRNYIRPATNRMKYVCAAQRAGVVSRHFSRDGFFEWRVVPKA
jgi:hypothetical protein